MRIPIWNDCIVTPSLIQCGHVHRNIIPSIQNKIIENTIAHKNLIENKGKSFPCYKRKWEKQQ